MYGVCSLIYVLLFPDHTDSSPSHLTYPVLPIEPTYSGNPWIHILRGKFPNMAVPGCFLADQLQHQLFRHTAKDLLCLRLTDAKPQLREKEEIRRLKKEFQDQHITLLVRHPSHNLVAEGKILLTHSMDCIVFFKTNHSLTLHRVLPISEYERCEVALQMPGGLDLLVNRGYSFFDKLVEMKEVENHLETTSVDAASTTVGTATTKALVYWPLS